jgi:hypothetical protein
MTVENSSVSRVKDRTDYDIFISYSRRDKDFVRQLWEAFERGNQNAWVDWDDIPPTADWRQEIYLGIEAANNFVFVISPHSIGSVVCAEELAHAIAQGKRLVPIVRQEVDYQAVHPELAKLNWIFFREQDDFNRAFQTLIEAIETDLSYVRSHTRLLVRAREWDNKERDRSFLLRGSDLEAAEQWLRQSATKHPQSTALHREYINVSRQAETERQEIEIRLHRLTPQEYRNRQALLNKVRNYWVKGLLENTLRDRAWIDLNLEERPQAVANPLHLDVERLDEPQLLPPGTQILDRFDALGEGRTLLILGEPGSGKTTTLLELARNLVTRAEQDIGQPIPVVFNLSSWVSEKQNVCDWLVKELNTKYQVPKKVGQTWVNKQQLLLLLDGLDEVQAEYREGLIDALNAFHQEYGSEIVVTSRIQDYQLLSNRLKFQSAVYLRSLTSKQVFLSLEGNNSYLVKLRDLLLKDEILRQLAQSPLMLNIITMAYEGIALEDLPKTGLMEERRQQLFHAYIERMFKRRGAKHQYSQAQTLHWLTWLAQRMSQFGQTVFLIEGMQPDWLQTQAQLRAYHIGVKLILGMVWGGLHVGLLAGHMGGDAIRFDLLNNLQGLIAGLSGGLIYGLIGGWLWRLGNEPTNHGYGRLINSLLLGLIFGPIFGWIYGGWMYGLAYTLIYGVIGLFSYRPLHFAESIEPIDSLRWSWRKALKYSGFGLIIGLLLKFGTPTPLIPSLIFGVMLSLIFGFEKADEVDRTTVPNQSIWKSVANSGKLFLTIGLLTGLILGAIENPIFGIVNGLIFGVAAALMGGQGAGIICIKHFTLRCLLWWSGYIPWNYARFLDYASERVFLQKVGGGYVFVHRLLCDHFARMELTPVRR